MAERGWLWEPDDREQPFGSGRFRAVRPRRSRLKGFMTFLVVLATVAVLGFVVPSIRVPMRPAGPGSMAGQHLTPTDPRIQSFADRTTMTPLAAQTFFDTAPAVEDSAEYSRNCPPDGPGDGSEGCYDPGPVRIHIFDVSDPALDGTMELTAAHEMLHAAWDQLGLNERARLTPLLLSAYDAVKDDPTVEGYVDWEQKHYDAAVDSPEMVNELHSILGTVDPALDPTLEEHYALYFSDRSAVVALAVQSTAGVDGLVARIGELSASVDDIDAQLSLLDDRYAELLQQYDDMAAAYNAWASTHPVAPADEIAARYAPLDDLVAQQAAIGPQESALSSQRDAATTEWNADAVEIDRLEGELDSTGHAKASGAS